MKAKSDKSKQVPQMRPAPDVVSKKLAHKVKFGDFIIIDNRPCRVFRIVFFSPIGKLYVSGFDTQTQRAFDARNESWRKVAYHEIYVDPFDELSIPKPHDITANLVFKDDIMEFQGRPGRIIDISVCKAGYSDPHHFLGRDIFTGKKMENLIKARDFVTLCVVEMDEAEVLLIADGKCSVIGEDGDVEEDVDIPNSELAEQMREAWSDGERKVVVKVAETMGTTGVIEAWEEREMKLLEVLDDGKLALQAEDSETMEVALPEGLVKENITEGVELEKAATVQIRASIGNGHSGKKWEVVAAKNP